MPAAGVAAIFKTPATGAVFALEVPYQDDLARYMLGPALIGSASSYLVFVAIHGTSPLLAVTGSPPFSFKDLAAAIAARDLRRSRRPRVRLALASSERGRHICSRLDSRAVPRASALPAYLLPRGSSPDRT